MFTVFILINPGSNISQSDVLLCTSTDEGASVGRPASTYLHQLCADTGCSLEDLPGAMDDRDRWRERERKRG